MSHPDHSLLSDISSIGCYVQNSLVVVHEAKLTDSLCVEESKRAARVVATATLRLPWPHGSYGESPLSATLV